jgi:RNA polymerase sigma factor (sigma-70 family)
MRRDLLQERPDVLARFRAGERTAMELVYGYYRRTVYALVRGACGCLPTRGRRRGAGGRPADVEDLVQEVFMKVFSRRSVRTNYRGQVPFSAYLRRMTHNLVVDWARKSDREVPTEDEGIERALHDGPRGAPWQQPERVEQSEEVDGESIAAVSTLLSSIPADLRAIHEQRYGAGLSQRDTAVVLGVGRQTVRTRERELHTRVLNELSARPPARQG